MAALLFVAIGCLFLAASFALIAVHETGHFLAGWLCGIPRRDMKIALLTFPQHVKLRDGDDWVSPVVDIQRFVAVSARHLTTRRAAFLWVAGGMLVELAFTGALCAAMLQSPWPRLANWLAWLSLGMYAINVLVMDVPLAIRYRTAAGDTTGMWQIARVPAAIFTLAMIAGRIILVYATMQRASYEIQA